MTDHLSSRMTLARKIAARFSVLPPVTAIGLGGSLAAQTIDPTSDIDVYVYVTADIPVGERAVIIDELGAGYTELNTHFWDSGDSWYDRQTGIEVDLMYWDTAWIEGQIDHVLLGHQASTGYTTCFWYTLYHSQVLYDRQGWLPALKAKCDCPYPEPLRRAIIAKNHPILRRAIPAYTHQIEKAIRRGDLVSVNHRVAAMLASYFDVVFALNRAPHPGEKRLLSKAASACARLPRDMDQQVEAVLQAAASLDGALVMHIEHLADNLDTLLLEEGFDPQTLWPEK